MTPTNISTTLGALAVFATAFFAPATLLAKPAKAIDQAALENKLIALEKRENAKIGVALLDAETGHRFSYRGSDRFALNSTFKAFACSALLARSETGQILMEDTRSIREQDLVPWSPVTENRTGTDSITLFEACEATMVYSDNTAANVVLDALGGPAALTAFMRSAGDTETRLDRIEPEMNVVPDGSLQDTTTPEAAAASLQTFVMGDVLNAKSKAQLVEWLTANTTAKNMLRKHLPAGWSIGDRSGASRDRKRSVIAVIYPPNRLPLFAAVYLQLQQPAKISKRDAIIAEFAETLFDSLENANK
ncbi:class A beta-lactamase [Roseibium denhamense]|uniref:class A beta-lactamase n=1 Tax=Roseibium denhamense TaxID=76305 RepID=UPI0018AD2B27|nr:class A beta-lactamase [Roseibium denhamense]